MKKTLFLAIILGLFLAVWGFSPNREEEEKVLLTTLAKFLEINHYHEQELNDGFSKRIYHLYMDALDYSKMYLLQSDVDELQEYELLLDDEIRGGTLAFYYRATEIMNQRVKEVEGYCDAILAQPFDFTIEEGYETDPEKRAYCKTSEELRDYWRTYLKHMTLNTYLRKLEGTDDEDTTANNKNLTEAEMEEASREQVLKNIKERFRRRNDIDAEDNFSIYVNAISGAFGPHTQYFPPQQKENFDLRMTGTLEGIGAVLQQEEGYTKISSIVTGSASWKQGQLKAGDVVLKVAQENELPVDIVDAPMKEVLKLIRGKKGTEVRLTVQKPDGTIIVIPIVRDVVIREETYAKSALFEHQLNAMNFGYIYLPSFYSKFGKADGRNSSDDIREELERLKSENVNGIVLDLRDNGGGSLQDAITMAGLFFDKGPVVQVKDKIHDAQAKYDYDANVAYDGALVILVNSLSASASEILAGALQDYDRAVVVGGKSTYGKGTVQSFVDLNRYIDPRLSLEQPLGSLKFTLQQFYRINGSSTQFLGVHSDIVLPDLLDIQEIGEKELDYALPWDSVRPLIYKKWQHPGYSLSDLRAKSMQRIKEDPLFSAIHERAEWLKQERENTIVNLNIDEMTRKRDERKEKSDSFNALNFSDENMHIRSLQVFKNEADSIVTRKRTEWEEQLAKDAYIREAMHILEDMARVGDVHKLVKDVKR
jgi:carboxyl-terminal processing protease